MSQNAVILDTADTAGVVETDDGERVTVRLANGAVLELPATLVTRESNGSYRAALAFGALAPDPAVLEKTVLREVDERLRIDTVVRDTGRVVAQTVTESREEPVDVTGWRDRVEVERVPIGRVVQTVEPARVEDGVTIVPVYEEVLVVRKELVLREEVRLVTRRDPVPGPESVTLRRQRVDIARLPPADADGTPG